MLDDAFGVIASGLMTTVHAYTGDPEHRRRPRTAICARRALAAINIIPTSTGAARATSLVMQSMKGKLDGTALARADPDRLGLTDLHGQPRRRPATRSCEINAAFAKAAGGKLEGVLRYTDEPIVSSDIVTRPVHDTRASSTPGSR